jgi:hypothetical protein
VAADLWNLEAKVDGSWHGFVYSFGVGGDRLSPVRGTQTTTSGRVFLSISAPWQP